MLFLVQQKALVVYLSLSQLTYNIFWNKDNKLDNFTGQSICPLIITSSSFISTFGRKCYVCTFLSSLFLKDKTKSLLTSQKLGWTAHSKYVSFLFFIAFDWYLVQLIVSLKSEFNCFNTFALSWGDKVTART